MSQVKPQKTQKQKAKYRWIGECSFLFGMLCVFVGIALFDYRLAILICGSVFSGLGFWGMIANAD